MPATPDAVLKSLSDPTRRGLFEHLMREGELTVSALTSPTGVSQPAVSKHLSVLKAAGLVHERKAGRQTFYEAKPQGLAPLVDWLTHYGEFWRDRFDRLDDLLKRMDR